ncbi:MAG TPA: hypothetical protein PK733_11250 [Clostridiales bacterium]|nr:hypothetical protein [Clostridiales bacterium]
MSYKGWDKLIEEFKASGKSQAQWCREKDLIDSLGHSFLHYEIS